MEYTIQDIKRATGRVFTTSDGHKYIKSKTNTKFTYLRCVLFKTFRCKATSKLQHDIDMIISMNQHKHSLSEYESNANEIKRKCKTIAKYSQSNPRQIFDDVTRNDPFASEVSFREVESSMYHARRMLQPKIPPTASEFCAMLPTTAFGDYYKFSVTCGNQTAVVFFSDKMSRELSLQNQVHNKDWPSPDMEFYKNAKLNNTGYR